MLGKLKTKLSEKQDKFLLVNCTRPVGQVLLERHSSEIKTYSSQTSERVEVFCPDMTTEARPQATDFSLKYQEEQYSTSNVASICSHNAVSSDNPLLRTSTAGGPRKIKALQ